MNLFKRDRNLPPMCRCVTSVDNELLDDRIFFRQRLGHKFVAESLAIIRALPVGETWQVTDGYLIQLYGTPSLPIEIVEELNKEDNFQNIMVQYFKSAGTMVVTRLK